MAALAGICGVALALRLGVCLQLCPAPFVAQPNVVTDMATYRRIALEIAHGDIPSHFYYQPFYYAVFLPAVYTVFGPGPWGPALVQMLLGTATVWLTGLAAARVFGRRAGLVAAGLLALARFQIFYVPFLLLEVLQAFWLSLIVHLALCFWQRHSATRLALLGLVTAAAVLTRGNAILLVPGIVALVSWRWRQRPGRALAAVGLCLVLIYVPQLPFALRNLKHFGRWTGPSSAQDAVLALGNNPEAPPGGLEYPASYHDWMELADRPPAERVPVSRQVLTWVRRAPLQFIELKARMLLLYWQHTEIPNNISIEREGRHSSLLGWPLLLPFAVLGSLGVFGLLTSFRRHSPRRLLLYYAVGAHCASTLLFYVLARFRLSAVPLICVFGGAGIAYVWRRARRRGASPTEWRARWGGVLVAAMVAVFLVGMPAPPWFPVPGGFAWYQGLLESRVQRLLRPEGVQVQTHRRTLLYDRGPLALGGLAAVPLPPDGLVIRKRFAMPPGGLPCSTPTLRVPVVLSPGTRFEARLSVAGRSYDTSSVRVDDSGGRQRLVFALEGLSQSEAPDDAVLNVRLISGEMAVVVDTLRWYGRTAYATASGSLPIEAEAAFELEWLTTPATGSP